MNLLAEIPDFIYPSAPIHELRHSCRGIIMNHNKEIAILHIKGVDQFGVRDHYELPGGGMEKGESEEDTLRREMGEELGVTITSIQPIGTIFFTYYLLQRQEYAHYFCAVVDTYHETHFTLEEQKLVSEILWIPYDELLQRLQDPQVQNVGRIIHQRETIALKSMRQMEENI